MSNEEIELIQKMMKDKEAIAIALRISRSILERKNIEINKRVDLIINQPPFSIKK